jgi:hypothetical protein
MGNIPTAKKFDYQFETPLPDVLLKQILIIGPSKTGKTWLTCRLLSKMGCSVGDIITGDAHITKGCVVYYTNSNENKPLTKISIWDTEGLFRPSMDDNKDEEALNPFILALISSVKGKIVLVSEEFRAIDEFLIQMICFLAKREAEILIIHNRKSNDTNRELENVRNNVMKYRSLSPKLENDQVVTNINGRRVKNLFLMSHKSNYTFNNGIYNEILDGVSHECLISDIHKEIKEKYCDFTANRYSFQINRGNDVFNFSIRDVTSEECKLEPYKDIKNISDCRCLTLEGAGLIGSEVKLIINTIKDKQLALLDIMYIKQNLLRETFTCVVWLPQIMEEIVHKISMGRFVCFITRTLTKRELK